MITKTIFAIVLVVVFLAIGAYFIYLKTADVNTDIVPPNDETNSYYTNLFNGTSAAHAIVAGVAALASSRVKQLMAQYPVTNRPTLFFHPKKLRELLVETGSTVLNTDGSPLSGTQPRVDVFFERVEGFFESFPNIDRELYNKVGRQEELTVAEWNRLRDVYGIGMFCTKQEINPSREESDPSCPEEIIWPEADHIGKKLDFDGDGTADLVAWTKAGWKIDLSSQNGFGAWDVEIAQNLAAMSKTIWPVADDYNSDGRTDFAVLDKRNGALHIKYTRNANLYGNQSIVAWDKTVAIGYQDYVTRGVTNTLESMSWEYIRPLFADYNRDGWLDLVFQIGSSGKLWVMQYNAVSGNYDQTLHLPFLTQEQLQAAPGWAYLPFVMSEFNYREGMEDMSEFYYHEDNRALLRVGFKSPGGEVLSKRIPNPNIPVPQTVGNEGVINYSLEVIVGRRQEVISETGLIVSFGGNDVIPMESSGGNYDYYPFEIEDHVIDVRFKSSDGDVIFVGLRSTRMADGNWRETPMVKRAYSGQLGGLECRPFMADVDGDDSGRGTRSVTWLRTMVHQLRG